MCFRLATDAGVQLQIIRLSDGAVVKNMTMNFESAILCPSNTTVAIRVGPNMRIMGLDQQALKNAVMPGGEVPEYWCWLDKTTIGIVTATAAYELSSTGDSAPTKLFDRAPVLQGAKILRMEAAPDKRWYLVSGVKKNPATNALEGCTQLYSVERSVSQSIPAYSGTFATIKPTGRAPADVFCFIKSVAGAPPELNIIEINRKPDAPGAPFRPNPTSFVYPAVRDPSESAAHAEMLRTDFPIVMKAIPDKDILFVGTHFGFVFLFDLHTLSPLFRFSHNPTGSLVPPYRCLTGTVDVASNSVILVASPNGDVFRIGMNADQLVSYIGTNLGKPDVAAGIAARLGTAGAQTMFAESFKRQIASGDIDGAIRTAINAPNDILRTKETIETLQRLPTPPGSTHPPIFKYFTSLMETQKLNKIETVELARQVVAQGKVAVIEKFITEDKVTPSEALGDMVMPQNPKLALSIYLRSGDAHEKVSQALLAAGEFEKLVPYALKTGYRPNWVFILQQTISANPKAAEELAKALVKKPSEVTPGAPPLLEIPTILEVFLQFQRLPEATAFLLEVLANDLPEQGFLQTKLFEINLLGGASQVAHALLGSNMFHHFDKPRIANLCEKAGLTQRALELYSDIKDIKRVLMTAQGLQADFLETFFANMTPENVMDCLREMLKTPSNEAVVVQVATKFAEALGPEELIKMFEQAKMPNGLYYFLGGIVNTSENKNVHYKYIVSAAELKQFKEVERVCRDSTVYDPVVVRDFLIEARLPDPRALIHVCDRYDFVDELTNYLWTNQASKFIEVYVQKVAPNKTPAVVGKLIDLDAPENFITSLIDSVRMLCPVETLVEEVEKRNKLRILTPWLESRIRDGATDTPTHNAIGKINIILNKDPQAWLKSNTFYDSKVVGKFAEKLDPYLAYLAYRRAAGTCDEELIKVTCKNGLFKDLARYLVERRDPALWERVLKEDNPHRREIIDCVTSTALPETTNSDDVTVTVKAFMAANLPSELINLLEKLVLGGTNEFSTNRNLQNLLLLTAVKCSNQAGAPEGRVMDYIQRLDNFDGKEIAAIALRDEYSLFEEAFAIYKKCDMHSEAITVLLEKKQELDRAQDYAQKVNEPAVWTILGNFQLQSLLVAEAVESYIQANDHSNHLEVIRVAEAEGKFNELVKYLEMVRKQIKERACDTALAYALSATDRLAELEILLASPNSADIQAVGDRTFSEGLFTAACLLFTACSNYPRLASSLLALKKYKEAIDAAKKANSVRTWREVNAVCVKVKEWDLARTAGLALIVSPDHMEDLLYAYESDGHYDELIALLEAGCVMEHAHAGIFTELGVAYSKYREKALMEHLKSHATRLNASKMLRACENARLWPEAVYLMKVTGDFDGAVKTIIEHSSSSYDPELFMDLLPKTKNVDIPYMALTFYLEENPESLQSLLLSLHKAGKLDASRVIAQFKKHPDVFYLLNPYLKLVASGDVDVAAVNEAIHSIAIEEEDIATLRQSIQIKKNFDFAGLATRMEKHQLLEFRRIAALLYKRIKRYEASVTLSKQDGQYSDAIETAKDSNDGALAESLLAFFESKGDKESFTACLYTCYNLIRPDVALELAWRARMTDSVMPFMIQSLRDAHLRIHKLESLVLKKESPQEGMAPGMAPPGFPTMGGMPGMLALTDIGHAPIPTMGGMGGMPGMPGGNVPGMPSMGGMPPPGMYMGGAGAGAGGNNMVNMY